MGAPFSTEALPAMTPRILRLAPLALILALSLPAAARAVTQAELHAQQLTVTAGPSPYGWNLVGIHKDLYTDPHTDVFLTAGVGPILIGAGGAYFVTGHDVDSFVFSAVAGIWAIHAGASYQWKVNPTDFIHFGVHVGSFFTRYDGLAPIIAWEHRL